MFSQLGLVTCLWVEAPVARLYKNFRGSLRNLLTSGPSSRLKHLENFSKILSLTCLVTCPGNLFANWFSHEKRMFCTLRTIFKTFHFSLEHFLLFIVLFVRLSHILIVFHSKIHHFHHLLNFNLQEKVLVFLFSLSISCLLPWFLGFLSWCWVLKNLSFEYWFGFIWLSLLNVYCWH